jgi:leucyl aminopeptidase (aminopeptidase T)
MLNESIIKTVLNKIINLSKEEKLLIITDRVKKHLAEDFFIYTTNNNYNVKLLLIPELQHNGEEPSKETAKDMLNSQVIIMLTNKSLSHTEARRKATEKGARIISGPGITKEILNRCVDIDYENLIKLHKQLRPIIANSKQIQVTTKLGTNITFSIKNTHGYPEHLLKHQHGAFGNLPSGEIDSGVINANGTIIIDGSMAGVGLLKEPIILKVTNNKAEITSNSEESLKLKDILDKIGTNAYLIAEFGIGTNSKAELTGIILEDEKVKGTIHFALGNDLSYNGENNVPIHLDGIVKEPTIIVDKNIIIQDGEFIGA